MQIFSMWRRVVLVKVTGKKINNFNENAVTKKKEAKKWAKFIFEVKNYVIVENIALFKSP